MALVDLLSLILNLAIPKHDGIIGSHHPLSVGSMKINWDAAKSPAPLDHAGIVMWMGDGDG